MAVGPERLRATTDAFARPTADIAPHPKRVSLRSVLSDAPRVRNRQPAPNRYPDSPKMSEIFSSGRYCGGGGLIDTW